MNIHVNEVFGISDDKARELIEKVQSKWDVLVSGDEKENFTYSDILLSVFNNEKFTNEEKYFLCAHISRAFEVVVIRELVLAHDEEGFLTEMCFFKE
jgi:hypothetical protein